MFDVAGAIYLVYYSLKLFLKNYISKFTNATIQLAKHWTMIISYLKWEKILGWSTIYVVLFFTAIAAVVMSFSWLLLTSLQIHMNYIGTLLSRWILSLFIATHRKTNHN